MDMSTGLEERRVGIRFHLQISASFIMDARAAGDDDCLRTSVLVSFVTADLNLKGSS
jgi:hypothetical protein